MIIKKYLIVLAVMLIIIMQYLPIAVSGSELATVIVRVNIAKFKSEKVEAIGGKVVYIAELAPVAIIRIPVRAVNKLKSLPGVLHISRDGIVKIFQPSNVPRAPSREEQPPQVIPWGVDRIGAPQAWSTTYGYIDIDGDGDSEIEVAIIDTGVDVDHPDLAANIRWGIAVLNGRISSKYDDRNGHGTHVAGTVAALDNEIGVVGVAPRVELYIIKALNNGGLGSWSDLIIAIDLAVKGPDGVLDADGDGVIAGDPEDDAPEVISMSLGGSNPPAELHDIIASAYSYNITIVAAAGNEGADSPSYPAAYPEVIAVGATDQNDLVPDWSNRNPEVAAPGVDILSTYPDDTYETLSGTSMATPHVSGTVALIQAARLQNGLPILPPGTENDLTMNSIRGVLHSTADDLGDPGYDNLYGYGIIRADLAVEAAIKA